MCLDGESRGRKGGLHGGTGWASQKNVACKLKWVYSATQQVRFEGQSVPESSHLGKSQVGTTKDTAKTREPSLSLIFKSITQLQAVVRIEYWHTHLAAKRLQAAIKKVNKTCSDIGEQISVLEEISELLESEMGLIKAQEVSQEYRLTDVMLKLKEFENQQ
ncbi:hypothetical protein NDU88_001937 [Pleurodeles waltl]|uniref:Uncharacterized protein n=1 Tax=Pleurodeles waltl TaxID=8319 RepID=A0AAV7PA76_PLEWA|nr:hypothetical protein NDU88_001937 [Pleurodeles waltl]